LNIYTNQWQTEFPTGPAYQQQIRNMIGIQESFEKKLMQLDGMLDLCRRRYKRVQKACQEQKEEIKELRSMVHKLQQQQAAPAQAPPASPSSLTKAKEPRQPGSYKPPQPRTCEKCSTTFSSGQALFRHLPDCQPFKCTKCGSTFPSNTTLHKRVRGCRRPKDTNGNSNTNESEEKKEDQKELPEESNIP
jgi:cell division septum initiation protein DivIVA